MATLEELGQNVAALSVLEPGPISFQGADGNTIRLTAEDAALQIKAQIADLNAQMEAIRKAQGAGFAPPTGNEAEANTKEQRDSQERLTVDKNVRDALDAKAKELGVEEGTPRAVKVFPNPADPKTVETEMKAMQQFLNDNPEPGKPVPQLKMIQTEVDGKPVLAIAGIDHVKANELQENPKVQELIREAQRAAAAGQERTDFGEGVPAQPAQAQKMAKTVRDLDPAAKAAMDATILLDRANNATGKDKQALLGAAERAALKFRAETSGKSPDEVAQSLANAAQFLTKDQINLMAERQKGNHNLSFGANAKMVNDPTAKQDLPAKYADRLEKLNDSKRRHSVSARTGNAKERTAEQGTRLKQWVGNKRADMQEASRNRNMEHITDAMKYGQVGGSRQKMRGVDDGDIAKIADAMKAELAKINEAKKEERQQGNSRKKAPVQRY